jgi:hypothetical protein
MVRVYTYLGTILTNKNELRPEIEKRMFNANTAYYVLLSVPKSQSVLRAENNTDVQHVKRTNGNSRSRILDTEYR